MGRSKQLATLIDSAPATLDTLNELAAALGDDANFSTTVTSSIATKSPLADPNFTGDVDIQTTAGKLTVEALGGGSVKLKSDGSLGLNVPEGYNYEIDVNDQEVFRIDQSGNVMIGTTVTGRAAEGADRFTIADATHSGMTIRSGTNSYGSINFSDSEGGAGEYAGQVYMAHGSLGDKLVLATIGSDRVTIIGNNVGIGTQSPSQMLHIAGASPQIMLEDTDASGTPYSKLSGVDGNLFFQADEGNEAASSFISMRVDGTEKMKFTDTNIRVGGGGSVDSVNTQFNMEFPATGGINFGSAYTFSNIYGDATGNLFLKANAYPANTGSSSRVELRAANSGGGMSAPLVWYDNGKLGLNNLTPAYSVDINGNSWNNSSIRMVRTDSGISNDPGIIFNRNAGTAADYALGGLWFQNSNYDSGDNAYALIRARTQEVGSSGKLQFITSNGAVSNVTPAKLTINHGGDFLIGSQFNYHVISGFSAPNSAFQYDFYRNTYGHPIKITCAISHWNSSYMSYTEGFYWGFNTAMTSNVLHSYNGGNGSWTISFPTNNIVRVRMNGDASYNYASGWYIKVEGNLRRAYTTS